MADVFVSYDRRDREIAEKVVAALTEQGLTVWWDDQITPHETWDKTIEREVDSAKRVLVLWTNHSVQSDWVRTEAGAAKESTPPKLIQARFTDCKVPLAFRLLQHVDLIGWTPKRKHSGWDRLIGWLKDGLDQPAAPAPGAGGPIPPEAPAAAPPTMDAAEPEVPVEPQGLAGLSQAPAEATPDPVPEPSVAQSTEPKRIEVPKIEMPKIDMPKIDMPRIEMPKLGSGGDADRNRKFFIGGLAAVGVVVVIGLSMMLAPHVFGTGGGGGGGFSGEERGTLGGYLDGYAETYAAGLTAVGDDRLARLATNAAHDYQVELTQGRGYRVLGACDLGCTDVDLYVTGPDGQRVGSDTLTDDYPVVEIPAGAGGTYTVRIGMPGCTEDSCIGAARVYEVR